MNHPSVRARSLVVCAAALGAASYAGAQSAPRILLDRDLRERTVTLTGLDNRTITYSDESGLLRTESVSEYVAVLAPAAPDVPEGTSMIWFTDGRRLTGSVRPAEGDALNWSHPVFGVVRVRLDDVRRLFLADAAPAAAKPEPPQGEDLIVLLNGDRLTGFVDSIGSPIVLEVGGQPREIPLDRVAEVRLANPIARARGMTVWLADGSAVGVASIRTNRAGETRIVPRWNANAEDPRQPTESPEDPGAAVPLADIIAVAFDAERLIPLASTPVRDQRPAAGRPWAESISTGDAASALLGAPDVILPGPMTVEWDLPASASRFGCTVELPSAMRTWGDCELVVSIVGADGKSSEVFRRRLNADAPTASVNVALKGSSRLRIAVEAGEYGPIQDRLVLHRALVLVDRSPG